MFRFMRPQRTVLGMSRLPMRVQHRAQQGQVQSVQTVRFRKPGFRVKNFAISVLSVYVAFSVYNRVVLDPLEKAASEAVKDLPEGEEGEEEETGLFIPFPGTTKQLKPRPYRGSDPEWQEFINFSKDKQLAKKVRDELATFVRQLADKHPMLSIRCGKGMKLRRYWLDVDFPTHPPPEFERSGIEITDDFIGWTTLPVDSLTVFRLRSVLWPSALAQSLWSFTRVMVMDDAQRLARMFGVQIGTPPPTMEQLIARHQQLMKGNTVPTKDGPPKPKQPQPIGDVQKTMVSPTSDNEKPDAAGSKDENGIDMSNSSVRTALAFQAHFMRAIQAFKMKFAQTYKPTPDFPPRGSILVSGMVEIDSPKAWLVFDVKAAWDPKERAYDPRSMNLKLRRMQMKKQGPLGGR